MKALVTTALLVLALTACGSQQHLADSPHSVDAYYADPALAAATIEACRAKNVEEARVMAAKQACENVRLAVSRKTDEETAETERSFNDALRAARARQRAGANS